MNGAVRRLPPRLPNTSPAQSEIPRDSAGAWGRAASGLRLQGTTDLGAPLSPQNLIHPLEFWDWDSGSCQGTTTGEPPREAPQAVAPPGPGRPFFPPGAAG